jgi:hypothetical protein
MAALRANLERTEGVVDRRHDVGVAAGIPDQHARQGPDLHRLVLVARSLEPAVAVAPLEGLERRGRAAVLRVRLPLPRVQGRVAALVRVPGVGDALGYGRLVDREDRGEIPPEDSAAGQVEGARVVRRPFREVPVRQVVADPGAIAGPVLVEGGDGEHVGDVDVVDELLGFLDQLGHLGEAARGERRGGVRVDAHPHPADDVRLGMGVLAAEQRLDLDDVALPLERLQVVGDGQQVCLGRQFVRRVPPVAVGERPDLA